MGGGGDQYGTGREGGMRQGGGDDYGVSYAVELNLSHADTN